LIRVETFANGTIESGLVQKHGSTGTKKDEDGYESGVETECRQGNFERKCRPQIGVDD
jgi:hypothetical protein